jgi:hypothetical protein
MKLFDFLSELTGDSDSLCGVVEYEGIRAADYAP